MIALMEAYGAWLDAWRKWISGFFSTFPVDPDSGRRLPGPEEWWH